MKLVVIEGGLSGSGGPRAFPGRPTADDVQAEAARRIKDIGYEEARQREFMTGRPMPHASRHLRLQIEFCAAALCRRTPIPAEFATDAYWPNA